MFQSGVTGTLEARIAPLSQRSLMSSITRISRSHQQRVTVWVWKLYQRTLAVMRFVRVEHPSTDADSHTFAN